jgi:protein-L-isoaspartate(D-aspartate) O-methyltransferase
MSNTSAQNHNLARLNMVDGQIKPFSVIDERVLAAFLNIPRENFLPDTHKGLAYLGEDLPLGQGRFLLEPSAYARLLQEAGITCEETVLDVGCATGYTSCILASLAKDVVAIDSAEWIDVAKKNAKKIGAKNITFAETSDDFKKSTSGPFDVIFINGAVQEVPGYITEQLKENGRVATFIRNDRGEGHAVLFHKHKNGLHQQIIFDAFIPMLPGFAQPESFVF